MSRGKVKKPKKPRPPKEPAKTTSWHIGGKAPILYERYPGNWCIYCERWIAFPAVPHKCITDEGLRFRRLVMSIAQKAQSNKEETDVTN